ncbi:MAG: LysE family translocator [Thiothrix sp.]|nr:MAG: LysE family translocator [Thiothrix sp.]
MHYFLFLSICVATAASPGPAVFLAIKNGLTHGFKRTLFAILGNLTALFIMMAISAAGLGALILASASLFNLLKIVGGLYLIYLGIKLLRSKPLKIAVDTTVIPSAPVPLLSLYREAFLVSSTNPKAIAFCTALFPQFIRPTEPMASQFLILAFTFAGCSLFFLSLYAALAAKLRPQLAKEAVLGWFNRVTGLAFVGFGVGLLAGVRAK